MRFEASEAGKTMHDQIRDECVRCIWEKASGWVEAVKAMQKQSKTQSSKNPKAVVARNAW